MYLLLLTFFDFHYYHCRFEMWLIIACVGDLRNINIRRNKLHRTVC